MIGEPANKNPAPEVNTTKLLNRNLLNSLYNAKVLLDFGRIGSVSAVDKDEAEVLLFNEVGVVDGETPTDVAVDDDEDGEINNDLE